MRRNVNEWDKLAKWVINNKLLSHNVRWLIQVPRLYELYKATGQVQTFEDVVRSKLHHYQSGRGLTFRRLSAAVRGYERPLIPP